MTLAFEEENVRIEFDDKGEPWFVLADVCKVLELANPASVAEGLPDEHRRISTTDTKMLVQRNSIIVDEPGLYRIIMRSRKPNAEKFMEWLTVSVIPSIRKTGRYSVEQDEQRIEDPRTQSITETVILKYLAEIRSEMRADRSIPTRDDVFLPDEAFTELRVMGALVCLIYQPQAINGLDDKKLRHIAEMKAAEGVPILVT